MSCKNCKRSSGRPPVPPPRNQRRPFIHALEPGCKHQRFEFTVYCDCGKDVRFHDGTFTEFGTKGDDKLCMCAQVTENYWRQQRGQLPVEYELNL
jgi:hypothetical protein